MSLAEQLSLLLPDPVVVFFLGMLPITELQGAIIFGITVLHMNPWVAFISGTLGCITMAMFLIRFLELITAFLMKHSKFFHRFFTKLFEKTRAKYSTGMSELGHLALLTYIIIPTPGSGAWTGALIAYVFGIPRKKSALILGLGLIGTGLIVLFGTEGALWIFKS